MNKPPKTVGKSAIRCAIYTRKSCEEGLELEFNSLHAQRESAEAFILSQQHEGWVCNPELYDDGGFSGGSLERPALNRLLSDIEAGKVDCVVVYKVDRLSRSLMDFSRIMETFDKHQASFVSVTQQFNTTHSMGRLTLNILLSFAQFEREIIGERIRDKIAAQRRKGKWAGGHPVLGYDVDRSTPNSKLVINAKEAIRVQEVFNLYVTLESLTPVMQELSKRGWRNKQWQTKSGAQRGGRPFDKPALHTLLTNPIYAGKIKHKDLMFDGEHEPIIEQKTFDSVQAMLKAHGRGKGNGLTNKYGALLKGLVYCGACNKAMVHTMANRETKRYRYYTCLKAIKNGWDSCPSKSLPAAELESAVIDQIRCIATDKRLIQEVIDKSKKTVEAELAELQRQLQNYKKQLARDHAEIQRIGAMANPNDPTLSRLADLHDRIAKTEPELHGLRSRMNKLQVMQLADEEVRTAFGDFEKMWHTLTMREQAKLVRVLVERVEYDPSDTSLSVSFHASAIQSLSGEGVVETIEVSA
jgi:site-specific DNA recombinase